MATAWYKWKYPVLAVLFASAALAVFLSFLVFSTPESRCVDLPQVEQGLEVIDQLRLNGVQPNASLEQFEQARKMYPMHAVVQGNYYAKDSMLYMWQEPDSGEQHFYRLDLDELCPDVNPLHYRAQHIVHARAGNVTVHFEAQLHVVFLQFLLMSAFLVGAAKCLELQLYEPEPEAV